MSTDNEGQKVTIEDVAREADVSLATVSLVLQNKGKLRPQTRDRVREAIEATGYKKRPKPNAVKQEKPTQIALVVDDIANPYFHKLYKGIDDNLPDDGCILTIVSSEDSIERQSALLRALSSSGVDRLVVVPATGTNPGDLDALHGDESALILAVRKIEKGSFNYIGADPTHGMMLAAEHLTALGHERIAFVGGYKANFAFGERYAGIAATLVKHGLALPPKRVVPGGSTRAFGREAALNLLRGNNKPSAMIGYNDLVALGLMDGIMAAGLVPGKDVAVVGYDDIPDAADQPIPLTTIATPADNVGAVIAKALLNMDLDGRSENTINITFPPRLVIRASCGSLSDEVTAKLGEKPDAGRDAKGKSVA
ncbi:MAG: LacI family DNA-binding transcriptional regulator [Geminicoccales bacterium]